MTSLDFMMEDSFECSDENSGDIIFVRAMGLIGGREAVEEYLAFGMFPLSANFDFIGIVDGETPVSKIVVPLPEFPLARLEGESNDHFFLERVELEAQIVVGSYICEEHDACVQELPNGGRSN
jgi:hypothetical protein